ncbi:NAD(P)H-dependent oxidoreductase [Wenzhouxiangella sp. XN24]|uniref:NADPH-dependent FMN reductase n=1 Tax=Wenzhouxiangella sp. XN24 TaxID=2713569 RepID=UPI0013EA15F7|nr:NAD(P)H-dependent oxidoreductase [Wenzhouxiangella sp. XN24]NGX17160.1 NAD(P)H-dependent oxidoreductase [Wenzhouxiangella sp. XN24]
MPLKLQTIIASTRPGRIGPAVGRWFHSVAQAQGRFECSLVDLADFALPVYDEPQHPSRQDYKHEHTKAWSRSVAAADAYVFVTPEYNYSPPPSLVNALDYLYVEWNYKPCAFVSYGGVSGGLRSAQAARLMVSTLKMMPLPEGVMIQMPWQQLDEDKQFRAGPPHEASAMTLLPELAKWAQALKAMR